MQLTFVNTEQKKNSTYHNFILNGKPFRIGGCKTFTKEQAEANIHSRRNYRAAALRVGRSKNFITDSFCATFSIEENPLPVR